MENDIWVHNLNPFLIHFSGNVGIRWYGLAYLTGFILGGLFMNWLARKNKTLLNEQQASDFLTYLILGVMIGGRLGYVFFYSQDTLFDFRSSFPYWGGFAVWEGGMASHGGFLGVITAALIFGWKHKIGFFHLMDVTVVGSTIGIFFGRIANFINGELMGRVCDKDFPLAIKFPQDIFRWVNYSPEKLKTLEKASQVAGIEESTFYSWTENVAAHKGRFFDLGRTIIEQIQNGNQKMIDAVAPILEPRHPSQLYAALTEALIPFIIIWIFWRKPRRPGLVAVLYLGLYAIGRIFNENFRLPDAHIANLAEQPLGITRGQFLSIFFVIAAIGFAIYLIKNPAKKLGGWGKKN